MYNWNGIETKRFQNKCVEIMVIYNSIQSISFHFGGLAVYHLRRRASSSVFVILHHYIVQSASFVDAH